MLLFARIVQIYEHEMKTALYSTRAVCTDL